MAVLVVYLWFRIIHAMIGFPGEGIVNECEHSVVSYPHTVGGGCPMLSSPLWDTSKPPDPLNCSQDHSYMTPCCLQSDLCPPVCSQTAAHLGPHTSPTQNLKKKKKKKCVLENLSSGVCTVYIIPLQILKSKFT